MLEEDLRDRTSCQVTSEKTRGRCRRRPCYEHATHFRRFVHQRPGIELILVLLDCIFSGKLPNKLEGADGAAVVVVVAIAVDAGAAAVMPPPDVH